MKTGSRTIRPPMSNQGKATATGDLRSSSARKVDHEPPHVATNTGHSRLSTGPSRRNSEG